VKTWHHVATSSPCTLIGLARQHDLGDLHGTCVTQRAGDRTKRQTLRVHVIVDEHAPATDQLGAWDLQHRAQLVLGNLIATSPRLPPKRGRCCGLLHHTDPEGPATVVLDDGSFDDQPRVVERPSSVADPGRAGDDEVLAAEHLLVCVQVSKQHPAEDGRPCPPLADLVPV
jgi:hypothetical protein